METYFHLKINNFKKFNKINIKIKSLIYFKKKLILILNSLLLKIFRSYLLIDYVNGFYN